MPDLSDLAPLTETVTVRGVSLTIHPLTLGDLGRLIRRFSGLTDALEGGDVLTAIIDQGDTAVAAVIACALRDPVAEAAIANLTVTEQIRLLTTCINLTLPQEEAALGEFLASLVQLGLKLELAARAATALAGPPPASA